MILAEDCLGLELVCDWTDGAADRGALNRGIDVLADKLMYPMRIQIVDREGGSAKELLVCSDSELHGVRAAKIRVDSVSLIPAGDERGLAGVEVTGRAAVRSLPLGEDGKRTHLIDAVLLYGSKNIRKLETVVEDTEAATNDRLGTAFRAADAVGERDARAQIMMLRDDILYLVAQAIGEGQVGAYLPIVFSVNLKIGVTGVHTAVDLGDGELAGRIGDVAGNTVVRKDPVCAIRRGVRLGGAPQPSAEADEILGKRNGRIVLDLNVVLGIGAGARSRAARCKRALHIQRGCQTICVHVVLAALVFEPRLVDDLRTDNLRVGDLNLLLGAGGIAARGLEHK